jgi:serine/threonine-protein kinase
LVHFAKWLLIGAVVASVPGSVVGAPTKAEQANAGKRFREGERLFAKHDYGAAAAAFEEAYSIAPHPDALLNAIDARRKAGDLVLAARNCQRLIRDYPDDKAASDARGHLGEITPKVARLELQVIGAATGVAVDGASIELAGSGPTEVYVDAGDHLVTGTVDGKPLERRITVVAGARGNVLLQAAPAPAEAERPTAPTSPTESTSQKPLHPAVFFVGAGLTAAAGGDADLERARHERRARGLRHGPDARGARRRALATAPDERVDRGDRGARRGDRGARRLRDRLGRRRGGVREAGRRSGLRPGGRDLLMQRPPGQGAGYGAIPGAPPVPGAPASNPGLWSGHTPAPTSQRVALEQVGRYELLLELASGGMGAVYVGRQRGAAGFERLVAIKRMHPHLTQNQELVLAFHEEARIASLIRHPNVVTVVDVYEDGGEHLLVMELIDGVAAASIVNEARKRSVRLPRPVVLRIVLDALAGLHAAHELVGMDGRPLQVVHRDVSPQNILVGSDGTVHITDFGIARAIERAVHTATGELKGKLRYMAPEQALGGAIDRRTDFFAMGIVAWEMLSGERYHRGENDLDVLRAAADASYRPLSSVDPATPAPLENILARALAPHPDHRFPTAAAFAQALEGWAWQARELAGAAEVAEIVRALAGERIGKRRHELQEVLAGRRPAMIRTGVHPAVSPHHTPTAQPSVMSMHGQKLAARSGSSKGLFVALGLAALGLGVGGGLLIYSKLEAPKGAAPAAVASGTVESPPPIAHVTLQVHAGAPLRGVRGEGVRAVAFTEDGARFELPRGDGSVAVELQLPDGTSRFENVTPSSDGALRVDVPPRTPAADPTPTATADASAAAAPTPAPTGAPKPPTTPGPAARPRPPSGGSLPPAGGLRKNPYGG